MADDIGSPVIARTSQTKHTLTDEERQWCIALREELTKKGVTQPNSDFLLAQFALIGKGNLKKSLQRVQHYNKHIIEGYGYSTDAAMATGNLGFMNRKWPGMMYAARNDPAGRPVVVMHVEPYLPKQLTAEEWKPLVHDFLLCFDACNSDLDDVRQGCTMATQCHGMGFHNFSLELEKRAAPLYQDAYPGRFHSFPLVGSGTFISGLLKLCRLFLTKKMAARMIVCTQEELYDPAAHHGFKVEDMPPCLGGTYDEMTYEQWVVAALQRRKETIANVKI